MEKNRTKLMLLALIFFVILFGCAAVVGYGNLIDEESGDKINFNIETRTIEIVSHYEFLGEGDITLVSHDKENPFEMIGTFTGGWNTFETNVTKYYGTYDPDLVPDSGDEYNFSAKIYDMDGNGKEEGDIADVKVYDSKTSQLVYKCCGTFTGNPI